MKYEYNYSFLERWMQANQKVDGKRILQAIGSTSNQSLRLYLDRKCPMPIISILRFCNTFHVPISAFIVDKEKYLGYVDDSKGIETESEVIPLDSDAFEPVDGYIKNDDKRAHGSRSLRNPIDVTEQASIVPGIIFKKNIFCFFIKIIKLSKVKSFRRAYKLDLFVMSSLERLCFERIFGFCKYFRGFSIEFQT